MSKQNRTAIFAVVGLALALLVLTGCEEEDFAAAFGTGAITTTETTTHHLPADAPLTIDLASSNGALTVRGEAGIQTATVIVTKRSRGDTLAEAQDRLGRIDVHLSSKNGRLEAAYKASDQDADVRRFSGVEFDLVVPADTQVHAQTSNGAISVSSVAGRLSLDTSNGAIDVREVVGDLYADTSNGRIQVISFVGDIRADTSNGEIWIEQVVGSVDADTSNGSISFAGTPSPNSSHRLDTSNGSIDVRVPAGASIHFDAHTSSGTIRSSLDLTGDTEGDDWSADLNGPADIHFDLSTSNGSIRINRLP